MRSIHVPKLVVHVCGKHGDIEVNAGTEPNTTSVNYFSVTPEEAEAMREVFGFKTELTLNNKGSMIVPGNHLEYAERIAKLLVPDYDTPLITAVRFSNGAIIAAKEPLTEVISTSVEQLSETQQPVESSLAKENVEELHEGSSLELMRNYLNSHGIVHGSNWNRSMLWGAVKSHKNPVVPTVGTVVEEAKTTAVMPVAAAQVRQPQRGCPMPVMMYLAEQKAKLVVSKFLTPKQKSDYVKHEAFIVRGCNTGDAYRVTSRWHKDVETYGVLWNVRKQQRICAANEEIPPSEEMLGMAMAIQFFENSFLHNEARRH